MMMVRFRTGIAKIPRFLFIVNQLRLDVNADFAK